MIRLRTLFGIVATLLFAGCASIPPTAPVTVTAPALLESFTLTGRLSVRATDRLDSAGMTWTRDGATRETIKFFTPFGSQLAEIVVAPGGTTLTRGKEVERADSQAELFERVLGVQLRTHDIARWVQGVGLDADGSTTEQDWKIVAENFQQKGSARIASRVTATRGRSPDDVTVRIIIDEFTAP